ncbi:MAG: sulfatase/phosphatase domain-containing protein, partial [Armatimonadota bacterium]
LDELGRLGIAEKTVFIFFSDNGGNVHSRIGPDELPPTNNEPLRAGKGSLYEGGTRVPLLVCWPGVVEPGSQCSEVVSSVDFYPTLLEVAGVGANADHVVDGESIVPLLKQTGRLQREAIFCYFPHGGPARPPGVYVRKGDWKLIRRYLTSEQFPNEFELYNLRDDLGETRNLARERPEKVKELNAAIEGFLAGTGAIVPIPNPAFDPNTRPVGGWRRLGQTVLSLKDGVLVLESAEGRTQMLTRDVPNVSGSLLVKVRARSAKGGAGIFYWGTSATPQFARERRVDFQPRHDGEWHEYELRFRAAGDLAGLRYDGSTTPTTIEVAWLRLCKDDGTVLKSWDFGEGPRVEE